MYNKRLDLIKSMKHWCDKNTLLKCQCPGCKKGEQCIEEDEDMPEIEPKPKSKAWNVKKSKGIPFKIQRQEMNHHIDHAAMHDQNDDLKNMSLHNDLANKHKEAAIKAGKNMGISHVKIGKMINKKGFDHYGKDSAKNAPKEFIPYKQPGIKKAQDHLADVIEKAASMTNEEVHSAMKNRYHDSYSHHIQHAAFHIKNGNNKLADQHLYAARHAMEQSSSPRGRLTTKELTDTAKNLSQKDSFPKVSGSPKAYVEYKPPKLKKSHSDLIKAMVDWTQTATSKKKNNKEQFVVYSLFGKDFKKVAFHQSYDDISDAKDHAKNLQKLYKNNVKVLVTTMDKFQGMTHPAKQSLERI